MSDDGEDICAATSKRSAPNPQRHFQLPMERFTSNEAMAYQSAQRAIADLKHAVFLVLASGPEAGMRNSEIGRSLGIHAGHVRHQGHISRTLLEMMLTEGVVDQDPESKRWHLRDHRVNDARASDDLIDD